MHTFTATTEIETPTGLVEVEIEYEYDPGEPSTGPSFNDPGHPGAGPSVERILSVTCVETGEEIETDGQFACQMQSNMRWFKQGAFGTPTLLKREYGKEPAVYEVKPGELFYRHPVPKGRLEAMKQDAWETLGFVSKVVPLDTIIEEAAENDLDGRDDIGVPDCDD